MSSPSLLNTITNLDIKRTLAHVFPGFLLFIGILMASDSLTTTQPKFTSMILNPGPNTPNIETLVLIGLFVGSILGIMVDGISHLLLENCFFKVFLRNINAKEESCYKRWMGKYEITDDIGKSIADYLYPKADLTLSKDLGSLKDILVKDYYSYYEFYVNSSLSMFVMSAIIQAYMYNVFHFSIFYSTVGFLVMLFLSILLMAASVNTLIDYKKVKIALIDGILTITEKKETKQ